MSQYLHGAEISARNKVLRGVPPTAVHGGRLWLLS